MPRLGRQPVRTRLSGKQPSPSWGCLRVGDTLGGEPAPFLPVFILLGGVTDTGCRVRGISNIRPQGLQLAPESGGGGGNEEDEGLHRGRRQSSHSGLCWLPSLAVIAPGRDHDHRLPSSVIHLGYTQGREASTCRPPSPHPVSCAGLQERQEPCCVQPDRAFLPWVARLRPGQVGIGSCMSGQE